MQNVYISSKIIPIFEIPFFNEDSLREAVKTDRSGTSTVSQYVILYIHWYFSTVFLFAQDVYCFNGCWRCRNKRLEFNSWCMEDLSISV